MKYYKTLLVIVASLLMNTNFAQTNFSVQAYKDFLAAHQNMDTDELLGMYSAGEFLSNLNINADQSRYFDSIKTKYNLTPYEIELLSNHGFVVSERMKKISFGEAFLEIFHSDLPVFVSTDAILHAFHISYDRILKDTELGVLIPKVKTLLQTLHSSQNYLQTKYGSNPEMLKMLKDVDVYLTVPLKLFELNVSPNFAENESTVNEILQLIEAEEMSQYELFSDNCRVIDWSQFKPRGHYDEDPTISDLPKYFKVMMWIGRTELYLSKPNSAPVLCPPPSFDDIRRQIVDSYLIKELIEVSNVYSDYAEIENTIKIFAGDQDNVTLDNLTYLKNAINLNNADELLDSLNVVEFQDSLKNQSFAYQLILSQILYSDPMSPDSIIPASSFMLFGQRFVIDSYVTATVVYDRISYYNQRVCRLFPSLLDVLFSIGNSASAQLLVDELNQYHYSSNLAALRYLIDSYDDDFWSANFYSNWLSIIRKLNPPQDRTNLPGFMQTAAFWQEKMNTQLSSWAELRHDNLLYAKQSYTGGWVCSFPYSYVEPFPEFYQSLKGFSNSARNRIQEIDFKDSYLQKSIISYFTTLYNVSDTLMSISIKELNQELLTNEEITFLQNMISETGGGMCGEPPYIGWYPKLFYNDNDVLGSTYELNPGLMESDHLVADMHTVPTDCGGIPVGWVQHVGTGPINLGVFVTPWNDGVQTAFIGPVMSYYEYTTDNFLRLTDTEWNDQYLQSALRPQWVNLYLADSVGNSRGTGPSLITSVEVDNSKPVIPESEILLSNYPNPFNPYTIIAFTIPSSLTNSLVELNVYDVQGRLLKQLVKEKISSGNFLVKWFGDNNDGNPVTSGVYLYRLQVGEHYKNGKMILLK